jgi:formylglycine-generating enzyme required for sulfatase activity
VGVTFLEETVSSVTAPPEHRYHQKAARVVLKALLPESGTDIKGHMRSEAELQQASGYASRPKDFDELIRILDSEIRLITPTDLDGEEKDGEATSEARPGQKYYQLTHDYLVPSVRHWLTRKQKETRRGRAELLLADRAAVWNARAENRQLPSLPEWLSIRWLTPTKNWTEPQRRMIRRATHYYTVRGLVLVAIIAVVGWGSYAGYGMLKAQAMRERLLDANTTDLPIIVRDMAPYRRWLDPLLRKANQEAEASQNARQHLHTSLALLPVDPGQVAFLYGRLLDAAPHEFPVLRDALAPHKEELLEHLWAVAAQPPKGKEQQRLAAACALATYDSDSQRWAEVQERVANDLVSVPAVNVATWMEALRPVRGKLLAPLAVVFRDGKRRETERSLATDVLADYAADQPQVLADLLLDANEKQFAALYAKFQAQGERGLLMLTSEVERKLPPDANDDAKERLAKRQANAGVALLKMNQPAFVWPLLKHSTDPRARSYLIHRFGPLGADAGTIVKRLAEEPDVTIRRALILSLGPEEFGKDAWTVEGKRFLMQQLQEMYRTAADPGLHAAAEWLMRQWQEEAWLAQTDEAWAKDKKGKEKRIETIKNVFAKEKGKAKPHWYVTVQGQTMVVIPGPVEFVMGSPPEEAERQPLEFQHRKRIGRNFAIAAKPVTKDQFLLFFPTFSPSEMRRYPDPTCPIGMMTWYEAAAYCNWLSKKEDIPEDQWCYQTDPKGQVVKMKEKYLSLTGYRLPTTAEWEYVCRAGAVTSRYYGESEELLGKYAWYSQNSKERTWPVGSKKPNDLGLFDLQGNVSAWCQESWKDYPTKKEGEPFEDNDDSVNIVPLTVRFLRGGSFVNLASNVRSAQRIGYAPASRYYSIGFRPARTFP